ncbi:wd g-beta repeat-containing protein [Cystoisospora suis]|uniref:Wd g-beta repeat-containing protein n=1 Tax=Cystoisospora suis TaxID=483139 RepID=A0A2C6KXJ0_9APIC|nr:wd g-beta repeat-containing protein [Cystoisospora suis]
MMEFSPLPPEDASQASTHSCLLCPFSVSSSLPCSPTCGAPVARAARFALDDLCYRPVSCLSRVTSCGPGLLFSLPSASSSFCSTPSPASLSCPALLSRKLNSSRFPVPFAARSCSAPVSASKPLLCTSSSLPPPPLPSFCMSPCGPIMLPSATSSCRAAFPSEVACALGEGRSPDFSEVQEKTSHSSAPSSKEQWQMATSQHPSDPSDVAREPIGVKSEVVWPEEMLRFAETLGVEEDVGMKFRSLYALASLERPVTSTENVPYGEGDVSAHAGMGWAAGEATWTGEPLARSNLFLTLQAARRGCILPPPADPLHLFSFSDITCVSTGDIQKDASPGGHRTNLACHVDLSKGEEGKAGDTEVTAGKRNKFYRAYGHLKPLGTLSYLEEFIESDCSSSATVLRETDRVRKNKATGSDRRRERFAAKPQSSVSVSHLGDSISTKSFAIAGRGGFPSVLSARPKYLYMEGLGSRGLRGGRSGGGWARPWESYGGIYAAGVDRYFRQRLQEDEAFSTSFRARGHSGCVNALSFSTDGGLLGSAGDDRRVLLWRVAEPKKVPVHELQTKHRENIFCVQFDSTDTYVLTCGNDGLVVRTALANPENVAVRSDWEELQREMVLPGAGRRRLLRDLNGGASYQCAFLNSGHEEAISAMEAGTVDLFDFRENEMLGKVVVRAGASVLSVAVHPTDHHLFAYCCCQKAALVDLRSKRTTCVLKDVLEYEQSDWYHEGVHVDLSFLSRRWLRRLISSSGRHGSTSSSSSVSSSSVSSEQRQHVSRFSRERSRHSRVTERGRGRNLDVNRRSLRQRGSLRGTFSRGQEHEQVSQGVPVETEWMGCDVSSERTPGQNVGVGNSEAPPADQGSTTLCAQPSVLSSAFDYLPALPPRPSFLPSRAQEEARTITPGQREASLGRLRLLGSLGISSGSARQADRRRTVVSESCSIPQNSLEPQDLEAASAKCLSRVMQETRLVIAPRRELGGRTDDTRRGAALRTGRDEELADSGTELSSSVGCRVTIPVGSVTGSQASCTVDSLELESRNKKRKDRDQEQGDNEGLSLSPRTRRRRRGERRPPHDLGVEGQEVGGDAEGSEGNVSAQGENSSSFAFAGLRGDTQASPSSPLSDWSPLTTSFVSPLEEDEAYAECGPGGDGVYLGDDDFVCTTKDLAKLEIPQAGGRDLDDEQERKDTLEKTRRGIPCEEDSDVRLLIGPLPAPRRREDTSTPADGVMILMRLQEDEKKVPLSEKEATERILSPPSRTCFGVREGGSVRDERSSGEEDFRCTRSGDTRRPYRLGWRSSGTGKNEGTRPPDQAGREKRERRCLLAGLGHGGDHASNTEESGRITTDATFGENTTERTGDRREHDDSRGTVYEEDAFEEASAARRARGAALKGGGRRRTPFGECGCSTERDERKGSRRETLGHAVGHRGAAQVHRESASRVTAHDDLEKTTCGRVHEDGVSVSSLWPATETPEGSFCRNVHGSEAGSIALPTHVSPKPEVNSEAEGVSALQENRGEVKCEDAVEAGEKPRTACMWARKEEARSKSGSRLQERHGVVTTPSVGMPADVSESQRPVSAGYVSEPEELSVDTKFLKPSPDDVEPVESVSGCRGTRSDAERHSPAEGNPHVLWPDSADPRRGQRWLPGKQRTRPRIEAPGPDRGERRRCRRRGVGRAQDAGETEGPEREILPESPGRWRDDESDGVRQSGGSGSCSTASGSSSNEQARPDEAEATGRKPHRRRSSSPPTVECAREIFVSGGNRAAVRRMRTRHANPHEQEKKRPKHGREMADDRAEETDCTPRGSPIEDSSLVSSRDGSQSRHATHLAPRPENGERGERYKAGAGKRTAYRRTVGKRTTGWDPSSVDNSEEEHNGRTLRQTRSKLSTSSSLSDAVSDSEASIVTRDSPKGRTRPDGRRLRGGVDCCRDSRRARRLRARSGDDEDQAEVLNQVELDVLHARSARRRRPSPAASRASQQAHDRGGGEDVREERGREPLAVDVGRVEDIAQENGNGRQNLLLRRRLLRLYGYALQRGRAASGTGARSSFFPCSVTEKNPEGRVLRGADRVHFSWSGQLMLVILRRSPPLVYATGNPVHIWRLPDVIDFNGHDSFRRTKILRSVYTLRGHLSIVNCCTSTPPIGIGRHPPALASCGIERMVRIWTLQKRGEGDADNCLFYPPDGKYITADTLEDDNVIMHFNRIAGIHRRRLAAADDSEDSENEDEEVDEIAGEGGSESSDDQDSQSDISRTDSDTNTSDEDNAGEQRRGQRCPEPRRQCRSRGRTEKGAPSVTDWASTQGGRECRRDGPAEEPEDARSHGEDDLFPGCSREARKTFQGQALEETRNGGNARGKGDASGTSPCRGRGVDGWDGQRKKVEEHLEETTRQEEEEKTQDDEEEKRKDADDMSERAREQAPAWGQGRVRYAMDRRANAQATAPQEHTQDTCSVGHGSEDGRTGERPEDITVQLSQGRRTMGNRSSADGAEPRMRTGAEEDGGLERRLRRERRRTRRMLARDEDERSHSRHDVFVRYTVPRSAYYFP